MTGAGGVERRELEVLHDEGGWRVGLFHNLLFTGIAKPPSANSLGFVRRGQARLLEMAGPVGGLTLVCGLRLGPFDLSEQMRTEIGNMMSLPEVRGHSAIVIESDGFAGAAARAVLGAVILLARPESPQKIFESRTDAIRYLATHAPGPWSREEAARAADAFTRGLGD